MGQSAAPYVVDRNIDTAGAPALPGGETSTLAAPRRAAAGCLCRRFAS